MQNHMKYVVMGIRPKQQLIPIGFERVLLPPAGGNKSICLPMVFVKFTFPFATFPARIAWNA